MQVLFPKFQKNITQGYVSEDEAGRRLALVVGDKTYSKSGVYWSWDSNSEPFVNTLSEEAQVWAPSRIPGRDGSPLRLARALSHLSKHGVAGGPVDAVCWMIRKPSERRKLFTAVSTSCYATLVQRTADWG